MFLSGFIFFCIWQNNSITISKFDYVSSKIPDEFNDFTIAHISDLHNKMFGKNQVKLLNKVKSISPDIIVITGDLIDRRKYDLDTAIMFASGAAKIAPIYYVSGNHEAWSGKFSMIKEELTDIGVHIVDDTAFKLSRGNSSIYILGLSDPDFLTSDYMDGTNTNKMKEQLSIWSTNESFKILLSHRPELFDLYYENNMNLIFTGHAHGGQVRIPGIGGLFAPDQGIFPKYTSGRYNKDLSTMFVSRGLGNSICPLRIFNRPEIVEVKLNHS
ncbi:UNVERIFIED_ORG: phosphoesterase [Clostridium botulinum]|nr:metallophosphoesterase [Clostridium botulinum]KOM88901.1 phosphoesterase [Clostridium botulinum]KOR57737.1 phosphoesterase [Clostridium botulinum]MBY6837214.1 metallophosphoesterase [Clostridium botulinum]MBY6916293.1 metallophosphoesterase [Clostridium botulinum]MBY6934434.1 metallophosphoesterase [Clostridium botulinum]